MKYVLIEEAVVRCGLSREVFEELLEDELIAVRPTLEGQRVISADDAEELRVAHTLMEELGVNVAGVEVILHMRRQHRALRHQVDEIVGAVKDGLRRKLSDLDLLGPVGLLAPPVDD